MRPHRGSWFRDRIASPAPPPGRAARRAVGVTAGAIALLVAAAAVAQGPSLSLEGRPVESKADGPCVGLLTTGSQRYVDCGNGTVYDTITGLLWLRQVDCDDLGTAGVDIWVEAQRDVADLQQGQCGLTDASQPGDWRLPSEEEWQLAVAAAVALDCIQGGTGGPPSLTDDAGTSCYGMGASSSFDGLLADEYWASYSYAPDPTDAYFVDLATGTTSVTDKGGIVLGQLGIWPVREGGGPGPPGPMLVDGGVVETRVRATCLPGINNLPQRYVNCLDGTVLDVHTGLVWLADASCSELPGTNEFGRADWPGAMAAALALESGICGLSDGSQPGDWRLATADEWQDTMDRAADLGCTTLGAEDPPALTDQTGEFCLVDGMTPFTGVEPFYWIRELSDAATGQLALTYGGFVSPEPKADFNFVWPVRGRR